MVVSAGNPVDHARMFVEGDLRDFDWSDASAPWNTRVPTSQ